MLWSGETLPAIDCHRHLGGSFQTSVIWEIIQEQQLYFLAESEQDVVAAMTFVPGELRSFHRFLSKFSLLDQIPWTVDLIERSIKGVCDSIRAEGLSYVWMRFSINKYMNTLKWHRHEAIAFVHDCFERYLPGRVGLVLALKYESPRAGQRQYAKLLEHPEVIDRLMGLDLVGDEAFYDATFYAPLFRDWNQAGKLTCAHVGETGSVTNVASAIRELGVKHIAHGLHVVDDPELMAQAKDLGICFDLALTSNRDTGIWRGVHQAIFMDRAGLRLTLGTDDPVVSQCTLATEFKLAKQLWLNTERCTQVALEETLKYVPALSPVSPAVAIKA